MSAINNTNNVNNNNNQDFAGKNEDSWLKPQFIAAAAAVATGAIVAVGKDDLSLRAGAGVAVGAGASFLATKWLTEGFGINDHVLGKGLGLLIGVDFGYAFTNLTTKDVTTEAQKEGWM